MNDLEPSWNLVQLKNLTNIETSLKDTVIARMINFFGDLHLFKNINIKRMKRRRMN